MLCLAVRIDQLDGDPQTMRRLAHAALDDSSRSELLPGIPGRNLL